MVSVSICITLYCFNEIGSLAADVAAEEAPRMVLLRGIYPPLPAKRDGLHIGLLAMGLMRKSLQAADVKISFFNCTAMAQQHSHIHTEVVQTSFVR